MLLCKTLIRSNFVWDMGLVLLHYPTYAKSGLYCKEQQPTVKIKVAISRVIVK